MGCWRGRRLTRVLPLQTVGECRIPVQCVTSPEGICELEMGGCEGEGGQESDCGSQELHRGRSKCWLEKKAVGSNGACHNRSIVARESRRR